MRAMTRILRLLLLLCGLLPAARAEMLELRQAQVTATVDGVLSERETSLPYNWDRRHGSRPLSPGPVIEPISREQS